jgi:predicted peroxiredoxin
VDREPRDDKMKVLIKGAWGSADPTQAAFPFHHANAFAEAGHEVQIFLLGEAVSLMRAAVAGSVVPVGWAPLSDALAKVIDHKVPIHV